LIVSQVLTLYTTPVIYLFFGRLAKKIAPQRATVEGGVDEGGEAGSIQTQL
jgi:hypothetical protein